MYGAVINYALGNNTISYSEALGGVVVFQTQEKSDIKTEVTQYIMNQMILEKDIIIPCRFTSQKEYVTKILTSQINKRLGTNKNYMNIDELPSDWVSYDIQRRANELGSPTEIVIQRNNADLDI